YDVRLIAHVWNKNHYQIVNISFFEHDSGHDYSTLVKAFITAAAGVATSVIDPTQVTTLAVATVVHTLADAVVDALPKGTLTDDDDFIDSVNTVEKFKSEQRNGAGGKSKVKFSHYNIMINHEGDASSDIGSSGYPYCPSEKFGNEFDCKGKRCAKSDPKFEKICEIK
ncbi:MAG: DUF3103 family protein, partial [Proteobacteria bacterium]|nr:DUF3103 family protein [Pseudomonadota bacterium]